ncbi:MAG: hypothetical protein NTZ65_03440 [Candidatus Berkelbacteria bacterium]|nr:hypothetical protein [Candidatus Berkelbacteria bacterium]
MPTESEFEPLVDADQEVRQFSKEQHQSERDDTAASILSLRKKAQEDRIALISRIENLQNVRESYETRVASEQERLDYLHNEIEQRRNVLVVRFKNWMGKGDQIEESYLDLASRSSVEISKFQQHLDEVRTTLAELEEQLTDESTIMHCRQTLVDFYESQKTLRDQFVQQKEQEELQAQQETECLAQEAIEDEPKRQVENVMKEHGILIVHSTRPDFSARNTPVEDGLLWQDKVRIAYALQPTLCASSIKPGWGPQQMFGRMGLLVSQGRIESANNEDAASGAADLDSRASLTSIIRRGERISRQIQQTVNFMPISGKQNEIAIQQPSFAGIYYCTDQYTQSSVNSDRANPEDVQNLSLELGLPIYIIEQGRAYASIYDPEAKTLVKDGEPLVPDQITTTEPDANKRETIILDLLTRESFKTEYFKSPEFAAIEGYVNGKQAFLDFILPRMAMTYRLARKREIRNGLSQEATQILDRVGEAQPEALKIGNDSVDGKLVATLNNDGEIRQYFMTDSGEVVVRIENYKVVRDGRAQFTEATHYLPINQSDAVRIFSGKYVGMQSHQNPEQFAKSIVDFLHQLAAEAKLKCLDKTNLTESEANMLTVANKLFYANISFLHGLAEQAQELGETQTATRILELVSKATVSEQLEGIKAKRLTANGRCRILPEDLSTFK